MNILTAISYGRMSKSDIFAEGYIFGIRNSRFDVLLTKEVVNNYKNNSVKIYNRIIDTLPIFPDDFKNKLLVFWVGYMISSKRMSIPIGNITMFYPFFERVSWALQEYTKIRKTYDFSKRFGSVFDCLMELGKHDHVAEYSSTGMLDSRVIAYELSYDQLTKVMEIIESYEQKFGTNSFSKYTIEDVMVNRNKLRNQMNKILDTLVLKFQF